MIKFICKDVDTEEFENTVKKALIDCAAQAIAPLYGDFDRTGLDYSKCKSNEEKRTVFAEDFLGEIDVEWVEDGLVLNDELYVEDTMNDAPFDLEKMISDVQKKYPSVVVSGAGEIDYGYSISEYEIYTEDGMVHVEYDDEEEEYSDWEEEDNNCDMSEASLHYSNSIPRMTCEDGTVMDALLEYKHQVSNTLTFNKEMSFALEIMASKTVLIYMPINDDSINEVQKIGFPLNPNAKGVLFYYQSDENYQTTTDRLLAVCAVMNGSDNEWACPYPALQGTLATIYELSVAINFYLQEYNLYDDYRAMNEFTILDFQVEDGKLTAERMVL